MRGCTLKEKVQHLLIEKPIVENWDCDKIYTYVELIMKLLTIDFPINDYDSALYSLKCTPHFKEAITERVCARKVHIWTMVYNLSIYQREAR